MITTDVLLYSYQCLDDFSKGHQSILFQASGVSGPMPSSPFFSTSPFFPPVHSSHFRVLILLCVYFVESVRYSPLQSPGIRSQLVLCGQLQGRIWRSYFNEKQVTNTLHTLTRFYRPIVCMLMSFLKVNADSSRLTVFLCECSSPARQASATSR